MKKNILAILIIISIISCKKDGDNNAPEKNIKENFIVEVNASCAKSDDFAMYYSEDGTSNFKDINAVWKGIKGGSKTQKIDFELDPEKLPTHFRLDFGLKKDQDSVVINNITASYYGNKFEFKGNDFFKYFIKNDEFITKTDDVKGTLTILSNNGLYKTPYYYPTQLTIDKLKEITTKK